MTFNYTYPTDTLSAIYFQTGRHIQASDPFMADPMLYNEKSKEIFDKLEGTRLGQTIQLNSPHYFQSQSINSFLDADLNTLAPQALLNITFPVTLGELRLGSEITLSDNERSWQYQERPDFLTAEFKNLNDGLVSSFAAQKFNYSVNVYRNSCQIYRAIVDRSADQVAIPYLKDQANLTAIDPSLAADVFNVMRLEEKIENITRVIGKPLEMFRGKMGRINIISRIRWKQLSSNLASQFVQPLTLDTYEDSKDVLVETPNEVYALADYAVMSNSFASNDVNWLLPTVNNLGTQGPNNLGTAAPFVFTLTAFAIDARGNATGTITCPQSVAANKLAFGDVFYFNNPAFSFVRVNTGNLTTASADMTLVLAKPNTYNENSTSTWFYPNSGGVTKYPVNFVGQFRPFVTLNGVAYPINNDPNINVTLNYTTLAALQAAAALNFSADLATLLTTGSNNILIPLCSPREHNLTFKTQDHYEFSFPPKMVQPYANINFNAEIDDTFMRFIKYTGNPDVVKSVPINMGYQVSYIGRATQRMTVVSALTTTFDNYQLNLGAVAIYSPSNSTISF